MKYFSMKQSIFFALACIAILSLLLSCKGGNNNSNNNERVLLSETNDEVIISEVEDIELLVEDSELPYEPIDKTEFVAYWKKFRQAILKHEMITLSLMIDSQIEGGWLINGKNRTDPMPKSLFLQKIYNWFTPSYLSILDEYDIEQDLLSADLIEIEHHKYSCKKRIGSKNYSANIDFRGSTSVEKSYGNTVAYCMGYDTYDTENYTPDEFLITENGSIPIYNERLRLDFKKTSSGIKLYSILGMHNLTVAE